MALVRSTRAAALAAGAAFLGLAIGAVVLVDALGDGSTQAAAADGVPAAVTRDGLAAHLERAPTDGRAWVMLARLEFDADRFRQAADAYERGLAASRKVALDAGVWCEYADALGMAQGGRLDGRPRELIERALALDARHSKALEMAGSAAYERGEYALAQRYWRALLAQLPESSPAYRELSAAIARAGRFGVGRS